METILNIKTKKDLKEKAQSLASELGVPLTTVVNSYLRQFIRERKLVLEMEPRVNDSLMEKWHKISLEANKNISKKFTKATDLITYLKI
jgi:addiction module RelB/DinJ family antitoxin